MMAQSKPIDALTDAELLSLSDDDPLLVKLTPEERTRRASLTPAPTAHRDAIDRLAALLPAVGGTVGGIVGGIGGTVAGMGVGGVPGAVGGAALLGAGGEGARQTIQKWRGKEPIGSAGQAATDMSGQSALQALYELTGQGIGKAVGAGMNRAAPWLMQKALKPTQSVLNEYRTTAPKVVQTLLDEGVNVTEAGLAKLQRLFGETNDQIASAVAGANAEVPKATIASYVPEVAAKHASQANPVADLEAIKAVVDEFMQHPLYQGDSLSVQATQRLKQGTYQQVGKKYGQVSSAGIEAQKGLARGAKEQVAANVPSVSALNARDTSLMAGMDAVGQRVAQSGNRDPVGFAWVTKNPTSFLAALVDRNPAVKSLIARGMYASAGKMAGVAPQVIRAAVAAIASGTDEGGGTTTRPASQ